jgi:hypothetical protein
MKKFRNDAKQVEGGKDDRGPVRNASPKLGRLYEHTHTSISLREKALHSCLARTTRCYPMNSKKLGIKNSDTGNRTPGYRVRGDNVSHYTISEHVKLVVQS